MSVSVGGRIISHASTVELLPVRYYRGVRVQCRRHARAHVAKKSTLYLGARACLLRYSEAQNAALFLLPTIYCSTSGAHVFD